MFVLYLAFQRVCIVPFKIGWFIQVPREVPCCYPSNPSLSLQCCTSLGPSLNKWIDDRSLSLTENSKLRVVLDESLHWKVEEGAFEKVLCILSFLSSQPPTLLLLSSRIWTPNIAFGTTHKKENPQSTANNDRVMKSNDPTNFTVPRELFCKVLFDKVWNSISRSLFCARSLCKESKKAWGNKKKRKPEHGFRTATKAAVCYCWNLCTKKSLYSMSQGDATADKRANRRQL